MDDSYLARRLAQLACPHRRPTVVLKSEEIFAVLQVDAAISSRTSLHEKPTIEMKAVKF